MSSRREVLTSTALGLAFGVVGCAAPSRLRPPAPPAPSPGERWTVGALSGKRFPIPDVNVPPIPALAAGGVVHDGRSLGAFAIDPAVPYPDVRSHRWKLGVLVPATNTSVEHELWRLLVENETAGLTGIGIHTTPVVTPRPVLRTAADLDAYRRQFVGGLATAVDQALLAEPEYLVMAMSLEHILFGIEPIRAVMAEVEGRSGTGWATWHDAAEAALRKLGARRIGLITPFDAVGNTNAARMFEDLGFDVVSTFGFACAHAMHIAHIPDEAKERAILERLATPDNRLDAVVQCGTNMSFADVAERLEPRLGIPMLSINATTFWYALREHGIDTPLRGGGRLLREH